MKCLTPEKTLTGDCEFLAANLYARSMFGESALANLSIEVGSNGFVQGKSKLLQKNRLKNPIQAILEYEQRVRVWRSVLVIKSTNRKRSLPRVKFKKAIFEKTTLQKLYIVRPNFSIGYNGDHNFIISSKS